MLSRFEDRRETMFAAGRQRGGGSGRGGGGKGGGRGMGGGGGQGGGRGMGGGGGQGRNARGPGGGLGAGGNCVCPKCGQSFPHHPGVPCMEQRCPDCGAALLREGSPHHEQVMHRRSGNGDDD